jgi:DNA invertase Pin-like site-specific DNA recombinase
MSTEHQQYSIENQKSAIADYAQRNGFEVIASLDEITPANDPLIVRGVPSSPVLLAHSR